MNFYIVNIYIKYLYLNPCFANLDPQNSMYLRASGFALGMASINFWSKKKFKFYVPGFYFRYSLKKLRTNFCFFNSDEEKFMVTSVESAHDVGSFKGLRLKHNLLTYETVQLINQSSVKPYVIKSKLLSDVIGIVAFVIDSDSLKNCLDSGI